MMSGLQVQREKDDDLGSRESGRVSQSSGDAASTVSPQAARRDECENEELVRTEKPIDRG